MTITLALKRYVQWNIVRLGVLEVAIVVNLFVLLPDVEQYG